MQKVILFILLSFCVFCENTDFQLYNAAKPGQKMPAVGIGAGAYGFKKLGYGVYPECEADIDVPGFAQVNCTEFFRRKMEDWLEIGGKRIDSANSYYTQTALGHLLAQKGLNKGRSREELFILSKVGNSNPMGYNETKGQIDWILRELQVDYVDMVLIHWPTSYPNPFNKSQSTDPVCNTDSKSTYNEKKCRYNTWKALVEVWDNGNGKVRSIGVSNYNISQLKEFLEEDFDLPLPAANQCHFNIYSATTQLDLVKFCQIHKISFISYSPFGIPDWHVYPSQVSTTGYILEEPGVKKIAEKYGKTPAQINLNWIYQLGIPSNPRSQNKQHMIENLNSLDFKLNEEEMEIMMSFTQDTCELDPNFYEACSGNIN